MIAAVGRTAISSVHELGRFSIFVVQSFSSLWRLRARPSKIVRAVFEMGVRSAPIILTVGCFTGLVLGLEGYRTLARFGSESALGATVAFSLIKGLGPVLTALMIVAQSGSAIAAELGIQRNSEQIDALETMGVNPLGYYVGPRLIAALLVFPVHTIFFDMIGLAGGYITGVLLLSQESGVYWSSVRTGLLMHDLNGGTIKALAFGVVVTGICAFEGFNTHRRSSEAGIRGVSQSTTRAVVYSSIAILALDYLITSVKPEVAEAFLQIRDLHKAFGTNLVLDGVDLNVERGSITTIMGKSGIGKSVLLKCVAGIYPADSGEIILEGKPVTQAAARSKDAPRLSYLFQNNALFDSLTAMENVALPLIETSKAKPRAARKQALKLFSQLDLGDIAEKYPSQISGGMQKRVALARALITEPQLILFDEPTAGLDPQRKNSVFTMVADYQKRFDFTALMVSHDIPEALFVSDRVAWLDRGKIRFFGPPTGLEVARDPTLLEFIHHRNELLSELAGQQGRAALFGEWPELRRTFTHFIVVSCATERRRPGSELGLRRFASYQAAIAGVSEIALHHSKIYFLDERHFGFGIRASESDAEAIAEIIDRSLKRVNDQATAAEVTRYRWSARSYPLISVINPASLWTLEDQAEMAATHNELTKN